MTDNNVLSCTTVAVSAFITGINQRSDRNLDKYLELGNVFLASSIPKIVFIDSTVFENVLSQHSVSGRGSVQMKDGKSFNYGLLTDGKTMIFEFDKKDMYFYSYLERLDQFSVSTPTPDKDTIEYMFVQCHKTEWMRLAILIVEQLENVQLILANSSLDSIALFDLLRKCPRYNQYIWMDYGIAHMWRGDYVAFYKDISDLVPRVSARFLTAFAAGNPMNTVYCSSCCRFLLHSHNLLKNIAWRFAGSVFGGFDEPLIRFADLVRKKCIEIMLEHRTLMWEVNVWTLVLYENPDMFDFYICDHTPVIIQRY